MPYKCLAFVVDVGDSAAVNVTSVASPELAKDKEREAMNSKPAVTDASIGASSAPRSNGKTSERKKKTSSWYNVRSVLSMLQAVVRCYSIFIMAHV